MDKTDLGDRMKDYENSECQRQLMPLLPVCARIDGRCFSKFTKGLNRPYDERLSKLMIDTTKFLIKETNAKLGYTQSDEISLVFFQDSYTSELFFGGKIQKIVSQLGALSTYYFNKNLPLTIPEKSDIMATFDARVWNVPNLDEAANCILWREIDASKNSVSMACREYYSHKEMFGKGRADQMDMLMNKGINWNAYPVFFKRGSYVKRYNVIRNINGVGCERTEIRRTEFLTPLSKILNRTEALFKDMMPLYNKDLLIREWDNE